MGSLSIERRRGAERLQSTSGFPRKIALQQMSRLKRETAAPDLLATVLEAQATASGVSLAEPGECDAQIGFVVKLAAPAVITS
jgi:hypothetical protein